VRLEAVWWRKPSASAAQGRALLSCSSCISRSPERGHGGGTTRPGGPVATEEIGQLPLIGQDLGRGRASFPVKTGKPSGHVDGPVSHTRVVPIDQ
jgi:hypothetical protein